MNRRKDSCRFTLQDTTRSDILYLFGQGNAILSGRSQLILKSDVCGNHVNIARRSGMWLVLINLLNGGCVFQELARRFALSFGVDTMKPQARECVVTLHRYAY